MLCKIQRKKLCRHLFVGGALFAAGFGIYSCSDKYDLDTEQPSGLNSIYGYLQEQGNFTNTLRLIDDLGQKDILSKTGSKTMFVANDDAFASFFKSNKWGVTKYEDLSDAQRKLLLNSAMIDNPYSTSMLSTAEGPVKGEVCRRSSSQTLYDSVLVVASKSVEADALLPDNDRFNEIRANHDSIVLFTDASNAAPMLHFTAKYLSSNKITNSDIDFIYNQPEGTRQNDTVYVNNSKVINANIFCKNGFVHQVDKVILPLDNMAEVIRKKPNMSIYSSIIERFAAPYDSVRLTSAYNLNKGTNYDSVFVKRYFSDRSAGSTSTKDVAFSTDKNGGSFDASLKYDPGWNALIPAVSNTRDGMMEDMAVMLVPSNEAMTAWLNGTATDGGSAKEIIDMYGSLEEVPNSVLDDLIRVNQLVSFNQSVPSRFDDVLNDANEKMGITTDDIDSVFLACNGVVYLTNRVFAPTAYSSVLFPAVIDTTQFKIIENAIGNMEYDAYLNSTVSRYIFMIPTNTAMMSYVDPVSYGQDIPQLWEFHYDASQAAAKRIYVDVYQCQLNSDGTWEKIGEKITTIKNGTSNTYIKDRLEYILDNIIVTQEYVPGKKYYKTKGNTFVKVDGVDAGSNIYGTLQMESDKAAKVKQTFEKSNGYSLISDEIVSTTQKSVAKTLAEHPEFSYFFWMLKSSGAISKNNAKDGWQAGDQVYGNLFNLKSKGSVGAEDVTSSYKATYLLNNYHYTLYAPTNDAINACISKYPTFPDSIKLHNAELFDEYFDGLTDVEQDSVVAALGCCAGDSADRVREEMLDFIKYHIQDNSIYVDNGFNSGEYESGKTQLIPATDFNEETGEIYQTGYYTSGRPYSLNVQVTNSSLTVTDVTGNTRNVNIDNGLYNMMANEYWYKSSSAIKNPYSATLDNSSSVVIHGIDGVLLYDAPTQFSYTRKPLVQVSSNAKRR
ncbi:MAG: fasciclin domain-containing protein [Bacteroidaceae bacterium]|nr:fasciclin domain-containing protein [Bacteroidaceae bacterium]